ncbi:uncharacterized protein V6R79_015979 [Siganus canaliculatus]
MMQVPEATEKRMKKRTMNRRRVTSSEHEQDAGAESTSPSVVSMKSDISLHQPLNFGPNKPRSAQVTGTESTTSSVVSMKSDTSLHQPLNFGPNKPRSLSPGASSSCDVCQEDLRDPVRLVCGHCFCKQCVISDQFDPSEDYPCPECGKKLRQHPEGTRHFLEKIMNHKTEMQKKFTSASEGTGNGRNSLNTIYTKVVITTGESEGPHEEHSFRHNTNREGSKELEIRLSDLFKPSTGQKNPPRVVLTKGVAGIGKSFAVQKFILDWAEGKENQDFHFVYFLPFRELNLIKSNKSLFDLLKEFHQTSEELNISEDCFKSRVLIILDGLDESGFQLDFNNKKVTSVTDPTSVRRLLVSLIEGTLLPDAKLWITSRPAAAGQIPAEFIDMVTEIRGFNRRQKEKYFKNRFHNEADLADRIISHILSSQTLDIMCQIPIFCWITAVLFKEVFGATEKPKIPQTLTEMMAHFLFAQTKRRDKKYGNPAEKTEERPLKDHKEFLLKLGKLAFVHLQNNNLIFYDQDLEECGIDIKEATVYSGFCTGAFRAEDVFTQKKVFFFVHLTVQEFFAALYVYDCCIKRTNTKELSGFLNLEDKEYSVLELLKMTVDKVLEEKNGHLDFFLRFLLGLMVETNRRVLQHLLASPDASQDTDRKILTYLKSIRRNLSPESRISLFQAIVEMRDHKVKDDIEEYLKMSDRSKTELTPLHCSALAFMLQVSKNNLDVLDLKSYNTSDEGRRRLIPAVRTSRKAILVDCKVTEEWVQHLAFGLKFPYVPLKHLDLSNNDLQDSGVKLLCSGLSNKYCRLTTLRLSGCMVTREGCAALALALKDNPSHLEELDLSYNNPGESGCKELTELKEESLNKLNTLNVDHCGDHRMKPGFEKCE